MTVSFRQQGKSWSCQRQKRELPMIRKIFWTLWLLSLLPTAVSALGLQGIKIESALNQPLNARVELISADTNAIDQIKAGLADATEFTSAGVARPFILTKLRFKAEVGSDGRAFIHITSRQSIREPFLDFLLKVSWPEGSLVREFVILLDPPIQRPVIRQAVETPRMKPLAVTPEKERSNESYGPVKRNETLWVIAKRTRPDAAVSVHQMMMALLRQNPEAFRRNNVNLLRAGSVLQIPDRQSIEAMSAAEARRAFQRQTDEWRSGGKKKSSAAASAASKVKPQPVEVAVAPTITPPVNQEPAEKVTPSAPEIEKPESLAEGQRLMVVETGKEFLPSDDKGVEYLPTESEKLRNAIEDSEQSLADVKDINQDLEELKSALESKIETLRASLATKNQTIDELKQQLGTSGFDYESKPETAEIEAGAAAKIETEAVIPEEPATSVVTVESVTAKLPEVIKDAEVAKPEKEPLWKDNYWIAFFIAVIVILTLLVVKLARKSRTNVSYDEPTVFTEVGEAVAVEETTQRETGEIYERDSLGDDELGFPGPTADVASVLTEGDIYLAYRRYTQAEALMKEAIKVHPDSPELKAKLLEIYAFRKDKKAFTRYLDEVHLALAEQSPSLWEKVVDMGRDIAPDHPAFGQNESDFEGGLNEPDIAVPASLEELNRVEKIPARDSLLMGDDDDSDIDLDFSIDDLLVSEDTAKKNADKSAITSTDENDDQSILDIDLDFDFDDDLDVDPDKKR